VLPSERPASSARATSKLRHLVRVRVGVWVRVRVRVSVRVRVRVRVRHPVESDAEWSR